MVKLNEERRFSISISAIVIAIAGIILSFLLLFAVFYVDNLDGFRTELEFAMMFLSGILFIIVELISGIVMRVAKILPKKDVKIALTLGAVIYALMMIFLFPYSLELLGAYLPRREMAPQVMAFTVQLSSCAAALICGLFNLVTLFLSAGAR